MSTRWIKYVFTQNSCGRSTRYTNIQRVPLWCNLPMVPVSVNTFLYFCVLVSLKYHHYYTQLFQSRLYSRYNNDVGSYLIYALIQRFCKFLQKCLTEAANRLVINKMTRYKKYQYFLRIFMQITWLIYTFPN